MIHKLRYSLEKAAALFDESVAAFSKILWYFFRPGL